MAKWSVQHKKILQPFKAPSDGRLFLQLGINLYNTSFTYLFLFVLIYFISFVTDANPFNFYDIIAIYAD